ncbi:MAG: cell surface protein SprA [Fidelibacterota bacterium]
MLILTSLMLGQRPGETPDNFLRFPLTNPYVLSGFSSRPLSMGLLPDTLMTPRGWYSASYGTREIEIFIDRDWQSIVLTEYINGQVVKMPFVAPLEWYVSTMLDVQQKLAFFKHINKAHSREKKETGKSRSKAIEVVGVNLGGLGRASLRVRGNVNISGKMVFQDQELVASSIKDTKNTHLEFDQKQNLNIEGKIGDRITVKMDQDSERDFDWENNIRITYDGKEDDIVQKIEAGNISLSLPATQYVTFSGSNKGLFGLKAIAKLGPIDITTIASIEQTKKERQEYKGGNEEKTTTINDYDYIKNQHFMIHEWFRDGVVSTEIPGYHGKAFQIHPFFPLHESGLHLTNDVKIVDFELYQMDNTNDPAAVIGTAYIDDIITDSSSTQDSETGTFVRLERNTDYFISEDFGYLRLRSRNQDGVVLGCTFSLVYRDSVNGERLVTIGHGITETDSTLALKMIKPKASTPTHPTWPLMLKNVYYLGASNINKEGFAVRIINTQSGQQSDRAASGKPYISLFDLDIVDKQNNPGSDEIIDMDNANIVSLSNGELFFPYYHPFANSDSLEGGHPEQELNQWLGSGDMYQKSDRNSIISDHRFNIEVDYTNPSSTISLGFMLVEGSEEITINGIKQQRGIDYQIDYFTGTIIMQSEAAKDPNAKINILYDKYEIVSFDKKVIIGTRAQMDINNRSFLGATALYFNQSVIDRKVEVGYEPTRNFIWDVNGRYELDMDRLSRWIDRLPLLEADQTSRFSIEGEYAQVMPNPNPINNISTGDPNGVAFVDDFEGAKRTTNPSILRRYWKESSAPIEVSSGRSYNQLFRGNMWWYNPYSQVLTNDIWPNQSTSIQAGNETTDILSLRMKLHPYQVGTPPDSLWAGITTPFYSGDYDQTKSKFFEIWLKGTDGKLTVDLGKISEDIDGNGRLNTEDRAESLPVGNGLLDPGEDTGLDGCFDEYEDGWGGCLSDETYVHFYNIFLQTGDPGPINTDVADTTDPNGDNWYYQSGSTDYTHINGTEGNGSGNQIQEGGLYPDTEDLDRSGFLDKINDYFSVTFDLNDTTYLAGSTVKDGNPTGWRLFRIPLSHFNALNNVTWSDIRNLRLFWSGVNLEDLEDVAVLRIAKIELVGNEWEELGIAANDGTKYTGAYSYETVIFNGETGYDTITVSTSSDSIFAITVINNEDNANYIPPKGVKGEYDPINDLESKEQSLVLQFTDLPGRHKGAAKKTLLALAGDRAKSYLTYDKLKMYVYGHSPWIETDRTSVEMFIQFGFGNHYYELKQPVYDGWDEELGRNSVELDLNWLTALKVQDSTTVKKFRSTDIFLDSANVIKYIFTDESGLRTGKQVTIVGSPALQRSQFFIVGVRNVSDEPITGEIWLDELRLSGVKKDRGTAMRLQSKLNLADIASTTILYSKKDADFHVLQERLGSNNTKHDIRVNTNLKLHKFLPKSWGMSIPVNMSYSQSESRPKYLPYSDVLVDPSQVPDSIKVLSQSVSLNTNIAKSSKSDNRLIKYTLDNLNGGFSASYTESSNDIMEEVINQKYTWNAKYRLKFGRDNYISPFRWLKNVPLLGKKFEEFHIYYTPQSVNTAANLNEKLVAKKARNAPPSPADYNLGLNRSFDLDYKLLESLSLQYKKAMTSDLRNIWGFQGYDWTLKDLDPGILTNTTENLNTKFNPVIFPWLKPNFSYSAGYRWSYPLGNTIKGANIGTQLRFSSNISLSVVQIIETFYKPKVQTNPGAGRRRRGTSRLPTPPPATEKKQEKDHKVLEKFHGWAKKIDPVSLSYTESLSRTGLGVNGTVPAGYKFGWLPDHGLPYSEDVGTNTGNWDHKQDFSVRSGLKPVRNVSLTFSYAQTISNTISGAGVEQWTITRDYLGYGKTLENGLPFSSWSLRLSGLEKLPFLKKYIRTASLDHNFSGKESRAWQFENASVSKPDFWNLNSFIDAYPDELRSFRLNTSFSPLAGLTVSFKKGISFNARYNWSRSLEESNGGQTLRDESSFNAGANYSHRGGLTIPLPMMDDFHIENTMNFTFNFDSNSSRTEGRGRGAEKFEVKSENKGWKAGLRISYSFTSRVSGGILYEYRENKTKSSGRKIDRDFGFDVNIAITG